MPSPIDLPPEALAQRLAAAHSLLLFIDYDGTLVDFTPRPEQAAPGSTLRALLATLALRPRTEVHVVSGRDAPTLDLWLADLPIGLHAEHGLWWREPVVNGAWRAIGPAPTAWKDTARPFLAAFAARYEGSLVEEKPSALAWHYRDAIDRDSALAAVETLARELRARLPSEPLELMQGDCVLELRVQGVRKGDVVERCCAQNPAALAVAFGDDTTDEDMFERLPQTGIAVHVGPKPSRAPYRLVSVDACRYVLSLVAAS